MNYEQTRGWGNNNPLNIRRSKDKWKGRAPVQKDPEFVTFKSRDWGYRAAFRVLENYWKRTQRRLKDPSKQPVFCIDYIIRQWAPESDGNNTKGYIDKVVRWSGLGSKGRYGKLEEPLSAAGREDIIRIVGADGGASLFSAVKGCRCNWTLTADGR